MRRLLSLFIGLATTIHMMIENTVAAAKIDGLPPRHEGSTRKLKERKTPQRGLGVAQLEKLRLETEQQTRGKNPTFGPVTSFPPLSLSQGISPFNSLTHFVVPLAPTRITQELFPEHPLRIEVTASDAETKENNLGSPAVHQSHQLLYDKAKQYSSWNFLEGKLPIPCLPSRVKHKAEPPSKHNTSTSTEDRKVITLDTETKCNNLELPALHQSHHRLYDNAKNYSSRWNFLEGKLPLQSPPSQFKLQAESPSNHNTSTSTEDQKAASPKRRRNESSITCAENYGPFSATPLRMSSFCNKGGLIKGLKLEHQSKIRRDKPYDLLTAREVPLLPRSEEDLPCRSSSCETSFPYHVEGGTKVFHIFLPNLPLDWVSKPEKIESGEASENFGESLSL
ncbi:uncharacterized protein LOC144703281 [Wolffia australiana]